MSSVFCTFLPNRKVFPSSELCDKFILLPKRSHPNKTSPARKDIHMYEPLQKQTVVNGIINNILDMINKGDLRPGCALPSEREFAASLEVSRSSLRTAIKTLEYNGILVSKPGSGTYVTEQVQKPALPPNENDMTLTDKHRSDYFEILETRRVLETEMAGLAATRVTQTDLDEMKASLARMHALLEKNEYSAFTLEDLSFHNKIMKSCRNEYLYRAYDQIFPNIVEISHLGESVPKRHWPAYEQHLLIYKALCEHDAEAVKEEMRKHIEFCSESVDMYFSRVGN